jgi:hypothetical protein
MALTVLRVLRVLQAPREQRALMALMVLMAMTVLLGVAEQQNQAAERMVTSISKLTLIRFGKRLMEVGL